MQNENQAANGTELQQSSDHLVIHLPELGETLVVLSGETPEERAILKLHSELMLANRMIAGLLAAKQLVEQRIKQQDEDFAETLRIAQAKTDEYLKRIESLESKTRALEADNDHGRDEYFRLSLLASLYHFLISVICHCAVGPEHNKVILDASNITLPIGGSKPASMLLELCSQVKLETRMSPGVLRALS